MDFLKNNTEGEKEMCQIMEEIAEKRFQKGIQKGLSKGIYILVRTYREFGLTNEQIIKRIMAEYDISEKEATKYVYSE